MNDLNELNLLSRLELNSIGLSVESWLSRRRIGRPLFLRCSPKLASYYLLSALRYSVNTGPDPQILNQANQDPQDLSVLKQIGAKLYRKLDF